MQKPDMLSLPLGVLTLAVSALPLDHTYHIAIVLLGIRSMTDITRSTSNVMYDDLAATYSLFIHEAPPQLLCSETSSISTRLNSDIVAWCDPLICGKRYGAFPLEFAIHWSSQTCKSGMTKQGLALMIFAIDIGSLTRLPLMTRIAKPVGLAFRISSYPVLHCYP
jgi:hypothetical protein